MAEPKGAVYLRAGGAEQFRKDTAKRFARRVNKTLLKIDDALPRYAAIPRDERSLRTQALLALVALCDHWLRDKQTKIDQHESFRAAAVQDLHEAAVAELRGLQNWAKAKTAIRKLIPKGSLKGHGAAPIRLMQQENWLEVLDTHHRRGQELKKHFLMWEASGQSCSFWEYLEKLDPVAKKELAEVSVRYVDDLIYRALFEVTFDNGLMRSRMSPVVQNMILSRFPRATVFANADEKLLDTSTWPSNALRGVSTGWAAFVLSPQEVLYAGMHVSGLFHHSSFLCGAPVLASGMLRVENGRIAMRTTRGYQPIDVLYRRVDDDYLDPLTFKPESQLGVSGIMDVYRAGGITIANAPGTGIADDKAIYSFMPEIVEFYTGEKPILQNVPTWRCSEPDALKYVLEHLSELVVKEVHGSGGYGMLIGPTSSKKEIAAFAAKLAARPHNYIAQPTLSLSTVPILSRAGLTPRHVDLRPFVLVSPAGIDITPGGLTRVALKKGSLVVNSSQGGGTKDSWVLDD